MTAKECAQLIFDQMERQGPLAHAERRGNDLECVLLDGDFDLLAVARALLAAMQKQAK